MISTHTSRVGCDKQNEMLTDCLLISTHTSRVGCDLVTFFCNIFASNFYSHIPCGMWRKKIWKKFLSHYFYSHIPCGMWLKETAPKRAYRQFLLTHPVWDVTTHSKEFQKLTVISTHTSRVGCDKILATGRTEAVYFYSHIPCGMWRHVSAWPAFEEISTHTSRVGCDRGLTNQCRARYISTHTSRVGCDKKLLTIYLGYGNFYSHIPCGMWLINGKQKILYVISTHTSRVGCDFFSQGLTQSAEISTHTSRVGCDSVLQLP